MELYPTKVAVAAADRTIGSSVSSISSTIIISNSGTIIRIRDITSGGAAAVSAAFASPATASASSAAAAAAVASPVEQQQQWHRQQHKWHLLCMSLAG